MATAAVELRAGPSVPPREQVLTQDPANNVTDYIYSKMGINLHHQPNHPIGIIKQAIYDYFVNQYPGEFTTFDDLFPVVSCEANFDEILIPADHVSRQPNDTYYVSSDKVLRCHTSAHQAELLRKKLKGFLVTGKLRFEMFLTFCMTIHMTFYITGLGQWGVQVSLLLNFERIRLTCTANELEPPQDYFDGNQSKQSSGDSVNK